MSGESLLIILFVGLIAGGRPGNLCERRFGIISDLLTGIVGAFVGSWLLPQLGSDLVSAASRRSSNATIGAPLLLLVIRLVRGAGGAWHRSWSGNSGRRL